MTTIHTIEDLIQVLDDHPEWIEALRSRLLPRELAELPQTFARFVEEIRQFVKTTNQFIEEMHQFVEVTNQRLDRLETHATETNQRLDRLETHATETNQRLDRLETHATETNQRLDRLETGVDRIRDDLGRLKGSHARQAAIEQATFIAHRMGLRRTKTLNSDDLLALIDAGGDLSDIPANELHSFHNADLLMEAVDVDGQGCYIAVEISFTANGRDTRRAMRNAEFLRRFTGQASYAAVAGLQMDDRIESDLAAGDVFWYQLDPAVLEAE